MIAVLWCVTVIGKPNIIICLPKSGDDEECNAEVDVTANDDKAANEVKAEPQKSEPKQEKASVKKTPVKNDNNNDAEALFREELLKVSEND